MRTSAIVPLQERILQVIAQQQPLLAGDMKRWLADVDAIALDCGLSALLRSNKIALFDGRYSLKKNGSSEPVVPQHIEALVTPPTAEQEAAASLQPKMLVCCDCQHPKPECEFRFLRENERAKSCNTCHGKRTKAGQDRANERRAVNGHAGGIKVTAPIPEPPESQPVSNGHDNSGPSLHPVISDTVFENVKSRRQASLNKIALLEVELANERSWVQKCDQFMDLYGQFQKGAR